MAWFGRLRDERDEQSAGQPDSVAVDEAALLDGYSRTIIGLVAKVGPAVVQVGVTKAVMGRTSMGVMPRLAEGAGSGVIFAPDGYILTNSHVVDGARSITITLADGTDIAGTVVGEDAETDIAVVRITPPSGKVLPLATPAVRWSVRTARSSASTSRCCNRPKDSPSPSPSTPSTGSRPS